MKTIKITAAVFIILLASYSFKPADVTLKSAFKHYFNIGVAVNTRQVMGADKDATDLIAQQFNTISPENDLKWGAIHPQNEVFNFTRADAYVSFGIKYNMFTVGHTLVWHQQTPAWVFKNEGGQDLSRDELLKVMQNHIATVVGRYKGKIMGWDVVNEAFNDDGTFRKTKWLEIIGEDFIEKAFEYAHAADPAAELYYNDYNLFLPKKCAAVVALIKRLKEKNIKITAVGEQGHYGLKSPAVDQIEHTIVALSNAGVKVNITELDINVLPDRSNQPTADIANTAAYQEKLNPYKLALPDSVALKLAQRYTSIFTLLAKHRADITRVTFWGLTDGDSWLNNFPIRGRTNYPLLFDRNYKAKQPVFDEVIKVARK